jgi:23S rRNA pseudouridine1911/1915/1917 synthase
MPEEPPGEALRPLEPATAAEAELRLDVFLVGRLGLPRAQIQRLVRQGLVSLDNRVERRPSQPVHRGVLVRVGEERREEEPLAPPGELKVVYQDQAIAVVEKPEGMVVHPGPGHRQGTLAQLAESWGGPWSRAGGAERPGIVHRLDRGTSGLLVLARTEEAHRALARQLRSRAMGREYWALVEGGFEEDRGRIEAALARDPRRPTRMAVVPGGREAITEFTVLERFPGHTSLRLRLLTGRTHQIRAHLSYIGRPLAGDDLYRREGVAHSTRPALHAAMLHLQHPVDGREMEFVSRLPQDLEELRLAVGGEPGTMAVWPWIP